MRISQRYIYYMSQGSHIIQRCTSYMWQGGRSCGKARRVFAEKFGHRQKFQARTYAILLRYHDLSRVTHFWKTLGKKCFFWSKTEFLWQEVHYYMVYIAYFTELNLQMIMHKNDAFVAKIVNTRLTKFVWPFLPLPKGCQLLQPCTYRTCVKI